MNKLITLMLVMLLPLFAAEAKPLLVFEHKYQSEYNTSMRLDRLRLLGRLLPQDLKREISEDYYPNLRKGLENSDSVKFKKANVTKTFNEDGTFNLALDFPKFLLTIKYATWDELDRFFEKYLSPRKPSWES